MNLDLLILIQQLFLEVIVLLFVRWRLSDAGLHLATPFLRKDIRSSSLEMVFEPYLADLLFLQALDLLLQDLLALRANVWLPRSVGHARAAGLPRILGLALQKVWRNITDPKINE